MVPSRSKVRVEASPPAMAESPSPSPSQPVQELASNGDLMLERYIYRSSRDQYGAIDPSRPVVEIPVVDLSLLLTSSPAGIEELEKLKSALRSWGCFQAINHGMTSRFLDEVRKVSKEFFALPMEEKQRHGRTAGDIHGYGNDMVLSDDQTLDWTDRLYLYLFPEDQRNLKYWPQNPHNFREVFHEYAANMKAIYEIVLRAMARLLNLEEDCFLNMSGERRIIQARFNFYPRCPQPDLVLGLKPHADGSGITILLQDTEVDGLQFLRDDQWFKVPTIPHALLINVGDQMEVMTNGIFKSPVHRVLANSERERLTLAVFCAPDPGKEIEPLEKLVSEERPRLYKKVTGYTGTYFQYYQKGLRPIEAVKI